MIEQIIGIKKTFTKTSKITAKLVKNKLVKIDPLFGNT